MILWIDGHSFHYEMENLCRIFFPYEKITVEHGTPTAAGNDNVLALAQIIPQGENIRFYAWARQNEKSCEKEEVFPFTENDKEKELHLAVTLFSALSSLCESVPRWGILTGIHPVKLLRRLSEEMGEEKACEYFERELLVSKEKIQLSLRTMHTQKPIVAQSKPESFSLYLSIPFCPTRCSYCSFVSQTVERSVKLIPKYVDLLCKEAAYTAKIAKQLGLRLESVYIGGGTPTTLQPEQLSQLIYTVRNEFDLSFCKEFTVEAGRPDTITREKLLAIRQGGISRISINPQTLNNHVLQVVGRKHSAEQTLEAFELARSLGFNNINMDLIAGLPEDNPESFADTLDRILTLKPENITVHSLALKHAAKMMHQEEIRAFHQDGESAAAMLNYANLNLTKEGYSPYYLYRQSRMVGNLENTGWSLPNKECIYNVYTMDETHTILACGAGAVSKIKDPASETLYRIFNFKYSYEYVSRYSEIISRKDGVKEFYEQFRK